MKTIILIILLAGCITHNKVDNVKKETAIKHEVKPLDLGLTIQNYHKINDSVYIAKLNDVDVIFYSKNDSIKIFSCVVKNKNIFNKEIKENPFAFRLYLKNTIISHLKENTNALTKKLKENNK
jgi:hypothetical protein